MSRRLAWAASHIGHVRRQNEDRFGINTFVSGGRKLEVWQGDLSPGSGWAAIADGMGGHAAGELASESVIEVLRDSALTLSSEAGIVAGLEAANARIFSQMAESSERLGMGSTVVGVSLGRKSCWVFNIGDSRFYLLRAGELHQLSIDDTAASPVDGYHRSQALTQSLGGTPVSVPLFPHVKRWRINPGDWMLLSSDGLTDMLSESQILHVLESDPLDPALALIEAALSEGARDNVTVLVVGPEAP